jgi:small subunit ribosomal protein S4e
MGKKGGARHLKRMPAPVFWPIHRKEFRWVVKPKPGPHPIRQALPLLLVVRDILGFGKTRKEARRVIAEGQVEVDGKVRREEKFPVGLMDVIRLPSAKKIYRVIPTPEKGLTLHGVKAEEAAFKLCRIENKTTLKGGHIQLHLHDGRNLLLKVKDPRKSTEDTYTSSDVLKLKVPSQEIIDHIKMGEGVSALVTGGKNIGRWGTITKIEQGAGLHPKVVTIEDKAGNRFQATLNYVFAIGVNKPAISMPEAD